MILANPVSVGNFVYCATYQGPHTTYTYFNDNDGHYHQWLYLVDGQAVATNRLTADITTEPTLIRSGDAAGTLIDVKNGKGQYITTITGDTGVSMVMFNPIPSTRELNVEIIKGITTKTVTADNNRITIVCILGPITVNDKTVESSQHVKIFPNKTVTITLPEHTVCALVQDK
jgi:hypothetical protein